MSFWSSWDDGFKVDVPEFFTEGELPKINKTFMNKMYGKEREKRNKEDAVAEIYEFLAVVHKKEGISEVRQLLFLYDGMELLPGFMGYLIQQNKAKQKVVEWDNLTEGTKVVVKRNGVKTKIKRGQEGVLKKCDKKGGSLWFVEFEKSIKGHDANGHGKKNCCWYINDVCEDNDNLKKCAKCKYDCCVVLLEKKIKIEVEDKSKSVDKKENIKTSAIDKPRRGNGIDKSSRTQNVVYKEGLCTSNGHCTNNFRSCQVSTTGMLFCNNCKFFLEDEPE